MSNFFDHTYNELVVINLSNSTVVRKYLGGVTKRDSHEENSHQNGQITK